MNYPATIAGEVLRLAAEFVDSTGQLITMTGGSATIRVSRKGGAVVIADAACQVSGTQVYYDWDTEGVTPGIYLVQFAAEPSGGRLFIKPYAPITVVIGSRLGT